MNLNKVHLNGAPFCSCPNFVRVLLSELCSDELRSDPNALLSELRSDEQSLNEVQVKIQVKRVRAKAKGGSVQIGKHL